MRSVYGRWRVWARRNKVRGQRHARLYARLTLSPAAQRVWRGEPWGEEVQPGDGRYWREPGAVDR